MKSLNLLLFVTAFSIAGHSAQAGEASKGCEPTYTLAIVGYALFPIPFTGAKRTIRANNLINGARDRTTTDHLEETNRVIRRVQRKCDDATETYIKAKIARMDHEYAFCPKVTEDGHTFRTYMYPREIKKALIARIKKDNPELCR